jgi:hypothetical protein
MCLVPPPQIPEVARHIAGRCAASGSGSARGARIHDLRVRVRDKSAGVRSRQPLRAIFLPERKITSEDNLESGRCQVVARVARVAHPRTQKNRFDLVLRHTTSPTNLFNYQPTNPNHARHVQRESSPGRPRGLRSAQSRHGMV